MSQDKLTKYGFTFGPMEVMRACADDRYHTLIIRTEHRELQISVSPKGRKFHVNEVPLK